MAARCELRIKEAAVLPSPRKGVLDLPRLAGRYRPHPLSAPPPAAARARKLAGQPSGHRVAAPRPAYRRQGGLRGDEVREIEADPLASQRSGRASPCPRNSSPTRSAGTARHPTGPTRFLFLRPVPVWRPLGG